MFMEETMRWYGPEDPVPLSAIRQAGASGVINALHQIPYGEVWSVAEIMRRKEMIEAAGLTWAGVESLPVHDDIKTDSGKAGEYLENYRRSLANLGQCGLSVVTYNFMPVLDWVRTNLRYRLPDGSEALFFDRTRFAAFDLRILQRPGAEKDYAPETVAAANRYFDGLSAAEARELEVSIADVLPGMKGQTVADIRAKLGQYAHIGRAELKANHKKFLDAVCPAAEAAGCRLVIHPDDPPFPIMGLPRVFSTIDDIDELYAMNASPANGVCFCAGSFSGRADNDVVAMFKRAAPRANFLHLRSTQHDADGNFYEANHLQGCVDMFGLVKAICEEQIRRLEEGRPDWRIPFRPDHGHAMLDDLAKPPAPNPGYTAIGRLRGLAEIRGVEYGVMHALFPQYLKYCTLQ